MRKGAEEINTAKRKMRINKKYLFLAQQITIHVIMIKERAKELVAR